MTFTYRHKVHNYKEYHSVCPLVRIGTPPPPFSPASVQCPSPRTKGGRGGSLACGRGGGRVPISTTGEKLCTLPSLCL